jgi:3-deoxy-D-arabino-heptulosonate 7-phosphate (DAHP) synthase
LKVVNLQFQQRSSREAGMGCGYEVRAEKHTEAYGQYVKDVFQVKGSRRNALNASQQVAC